MPSYVTSHRSASAAAAGSVDGDGDDTMTVLPEHDPRLSRLESIVLAEYRKLAENLDTLASRLGNLAEQKPTPEVADGLRMLERKTALVCTALKSSVYGIVLMQSIDGAGGPEGIEDEG